MDVKKYVVIVAGGKGLRMGTDLPKQFLEMLGKPVLMHTIEAFKSYDEDISVVLVLPKEQVEFWESLCEKHSFQIEHIVAHGGAERFFSVKNGLNQITEENSVVAIHDGVRPLVSKATIAECFDVAQEKGNAIPCVGVPDTVRVVDETGSNVIDRNTIRLVQTPQTFRFSVLKDAYDIVFTPDITDDASVIEKNGMTVNLVEGNRGNMKITSPGDLFLAEQLKRKHLSE